MEIYKLRAHHLMCTMGYKGYNYSEEAKNSWDEFSKAVKENPDIKVMIIDGRDSLCSNCPTGDKFVNSCRENNVKNLDDSIRKLLSIELNQIYKYSDLCSKLFDALNPEKHAKLCGECIWRTYGLCSETFAKTIENLAKFVVK